MTLAVCLKYGKMKFGAWNICPECGHEPETLEDRAKHLMRSDHFHAHQELEQLSMRIKLGEAWFFDEEATRQVIQGLMEAEQENAVEDLSQS